MRTGDVGYAHALETIFQLALPVAELVFYTCCTLDFQVCKQPTSQVCKQLTFVAAGRQDPFRSLDTPLARTPYNFFLV